MMSINLWEKYIWTLYDMYYLETKLAGFFSCFYILPTPLEVRGLSFLPKIFVMFNVIHH